MYDLPMTESIDRKHYVKFRREMLKLGCYIVQYSVYAKVLRNEIYYNSFINKLSTIMPEQGEVRVVRITEKQYSNMIFLSGATNNYERKISSKEIVVF